MHVPAAMHHAVPVLGARHVSFKSTRATDKQHVRENNYPGQFYTGTHDCIICKFETINNTLL